MPYFFHASDLRMLIWMSCSKVNPPSSDTRFIDAVHRLEDSEGSAVEAIVTPGDWHHFHMVAWAKAWPHAKVGVAVAPQSKH